MSTAGAAPLPGGPAAPHADFRAPLGRTMPQMTVDLIDECLAEEKPVRIKQTGYRLPVEGAKPANYKYKMTDADVLECRRLYENEGWKPKDLATRYGVGRDYVYSLIHYATRSKLVPR